MRVVTIVPTFKGDSAFFDLPDLGFQGDHLSFAILFNLNELVEHWPNILPSMIVTDPQGNTYIAPHTSWNAETHIFTWGISSTETTYEGYLKCQLKCISAEDPETIVCMSRICQARVYQSLEAAADPPEAFQTWIDTLVELGAQINADASEIFASVETTQTNARVAQAAADEAESHKNAAQQARNQIEQSARIAVNAQEGASQAQQRAQNAASAAETARNEAVIANQEAQQALEEVDQQAAAVRQLVNSAADSATQAANSMAGANNAKNEAVAAKEAAQVARGGAETAQRRAETAEEGAAAAQTGSERAKEAAETAQQASEDAQSAAEDAQAAAEAARDRSETAQGLSENAQAAAEAARDRAETARDGVEYYADRARRWAEGKDYQGNDIPDTDPAYEHHSEYWAHKAEENASIMYTYMADIKANVGLVKKIPITIAPSDWIGGGSGKYPYYVDISDEAIENTQLPIITLDEESLEIASNSMLCATIRSYNGFVRIKAEELPEDTLSGTLYLIGAGLSGDFIPPAVDDFGIATDDDVRDMIDDIYGS